MADELSMDDIRGMLDRGEDIPLEGGGVLRKREDGRWEHLPADFFVPDERAEDVRAAFERASRRGLTRVPTNAELAERAKDQELVTLVRGWLRRHVQKPAGLTPSSTRDEWLDWAANNFIADPEIAASLTISHQHAYQRGYQDGRRAEGDLGDREPSKKKKKKKKKKKRLR